jgi:uncharacterized OB-fold protein
MSTDATVPQEEPYRLLGSTDELRAEVYYPARALSVDGALRELETVELSTEGTLYSWTALGPTVYGQVDLPEGVRLLAELDDGPHRIGGRYRLVADSNAGPGWRFVHV